MHGRYAGYTASLTSASKILGRVVNETIFSALALESHDVSKLHFATGSRRRYTGRPMNLKDCSSLVFGLDYSLSSGTSICVGKEMEDESPMDLGLCINSNVAVVEKTQFYQKSTYAAVKMRRPVLDLQLSLSTGLTESDVPSVSQGFTPCHKYSQSALTPRVEKEDEGSTSSRWKSGPLVPPLQNVVITSNQNHIYTNPPVSSNISSIFVQNPCLVCPIEQQQQQRRTSVKRCRFEGCNKGARGVSGLCISHGGGQRCQRDGCQKGAEGKTIFCKSHGGGRRCQYLGCTKSAEGRTEYCIRHGGGRRCSHEGCPRAAIGKSSLCIRHGGGKRCKIESCSRSAEGITGLCISHGGGRRCQYPECTKGAQGSTIFCKSHGGGRRCKFLGCMKGAEGSSSLCKRHGGGKRCTSEGCSKSVHGGTLFCVSHGGGKRCAMPECTKSARGCTAYCVRHGGGKRCKFEECTKSAQGSTDFCKRHGGGRQCSWGHMGLTFGGLGAITCDKLAKGKSGLCAAHSALVQEEQDHGNFSTGAPIETWSIGNRSRLGSLPATSQDNNLMIGSSCVDGFSLPEGRVHGGSLMAMLSGGAMFGKGNHSPLRQ